MINLKASFSKEGGLFICLIERGGLKDVKERATEKGVKTESLSTTIHYHCQDDLSLVSLIR